MAKVVNKKVRLKLVGLDRNAFALMGAFQRAAQLQGWTEEEIDAVLGECQSGNYSHLLATLADHCEHGGFGGDEEEDGEED